MGVSVVFPRLILKHILRIKAFITDEHPQEYIQVNNVIGTVLSNIIRVRFGLHIVAKNFNKYVDTTFLNIPS